MKAPAHDSPPPVPTPPPTPEEPVLGLLHSFDPATAWHEFELLDEADPAPSVPPAADQESA
ncbi:hypothetical protein [Hymenobacter chitinivorans]|uniref:Uncharacterized protein n=1 Tax=Hymenobacter chitinivorans DSM 11115 TaxID=1121954 RepID=A0A2M9BQM9_9BACT|nr:hypothetical protein [Hymenobacter chitinivorans]PJJ60202.1 hypothetical protein CLV45_1627 [Hymenobacter chitinivorans DSM 11115]